MTTKKARKPRKLAHEILLVLGIAAVSALLVFDLLLLGAVAIVDKVTAAYGITLTLAQQMHLDGWIFNLSVLFSVGCFIVLFLFLLGERLSYIREIFRGIDALQCGQQDYVVPIKGGNELTQLAEAVNYLSATQRQIREKERALQEEKEQLIRTLSHDIRTPLTAILAYSEFLMAQGSCTPQDLALIRKKAEQIKELTNILLDGGRRSPERFDDAHLLMAQLADEFEATLEDTFHVSVDLAQCPSFAGTFDVQELRRIFDNLISNIQKYADPSHPVTLSLAVQAGALVIRQENHILAEARHVESHRMGLNSIRRIAHHYAGGVEISEEQGVFRITITLSEI